MSKRAVILAGGKGVRLKPYTAVLPKPLMPVGDYSILEVIVRQLAYNGFDRITMTVNHQADIIMALFGNGSKWDVEIDYSIEDKPLSTMAPLKLIHDLPNDFLVMNGDILTDLNFSELYDYHVKHQNVFTVSSYKREEVSEFGVLETDSAGTLTGFREKPVHSYQVSMGVYMVNKKALDYLPEEGAYGFDQLMLQLIDAGNPAGVKEFDGYWLDIGRPDDYMEAVEKFDELKERFIK